MRTTWPPGDVISWPGNEESLDGNECHVAYVKFHEASDAPMESQARGRLNGTTGEPYNSHADLRRPREVAMVARATIVHQRISVSDGQDRRLQLR